MTTLQQEIEQQKKLAARMSRRLKDLRAGTGLQVVVVSGSESGYSFTKVGLAKKTAGSKGKRPGGCVIRRSK